MSEIYHIKHDMQDRNLFDCEVGALTPGPRGLITVLNELSYAIRHSEDPVNMDFEPIIEFIKNSKPEGIKLIQKTDERLNNLLRFINENLDKELNIKVLAEKYFSHPTHFIRSFRDKTGTTPKQYVRQKRIENAKLLLEKTDLTIWEITQKIGFKDETHFYRCFKETYNMSPTTYRNYYKSQLII